jgi:hypothetical protein
MPSPVQSETDAFRLTIGALVLAVVAVVAGWATTPIFGVVVFLVLGLLGLTTHLRSPGRGRRLPLREVAVLRDLRGSPAARPHVLVIANVPLQGRELQERMERLVARRAEIDILAPVLTSRVHLAVTDIDEEIAAARARLRDSLAWATAQGWSVRGHIGDPSPETAIEDRLRDFGADEVVVVTAEGEQLWQVGVELEQLRSQLDVPVQEVQATV